MPMRQSKAFLRQPCRLGVVALNQGEGGRGRDNLAAERIRLLGTLRAHPPDSGSALLDDLVGATERFLAGRPAEDDMTLLCAHVEV